MRLAHRTYPTCRSTDLHDIDHCIVASATRDSLCHITGKPPVLTGLHRHLGSPANLRVPMDVLSLHWLLDPMKIVIGKPRNAPTSLDGLKRLIVVDHQLDIGTDHFPDR